MVLPVSNPFSVLRPRALHRPILNSVPILSQPLTPRFGTFNSMYAQFWRWYRTTPELGAIINVVVTDVLGDRPAWTDIKGKPLGRNKRLEAQKRWRDDMMKETMNAIFRDMAVTGDGYGWQGKLSEEQRINVAKEMVKDMRLQLSMKINLVKAIAQDEDLKLPRKFDYVPSSTVQIMADNYSVLGYVQNSNGLTVEFKPEEIIHFRWQTIDGKIEGFSPVEALVKELSLIWFVKGNMQAYMANGGSPGKLFIVKDSQPGQPAFDRFADQLRAFKDVKNRHGSYLGSGDIDVKDLDLNPKDLEYENLALYVTSTLAFAFNIPVTRIPFLIGKAANRGDSGGMAEQGYWNMISEKQDYVEDLLNSQYFEQFGYHIHLNRKYKQDEVREAQTFSMNADTVTKVNTLLRSRKKKLSDAYVAQFLNIPEEEMEELPEDEMMDPMQKTGLANQNQLDNMSTEKEPDNRKRADTKRNVANDSANKGLSV